MLIKHGNPTQEEVYDFAWGNTIYNRCMAKEIMFLFDKSYRCPRCKSKVEITDIDEGQRLIRCVKKSCIAVVFPYPIPEEIAYPPPSPNKVLSHNSGKLWKLWGITKTVLDNHRKANNVPELRWDIDLAEAARAHAIYKANQPTNKEEGIFPNDRIINIPYFKNGFGGAIGYRDTCNIKYDKWGIAKISDCYPQNVINLLSTAPEYNAALLNTETTHMGIGSALCDNGDLLMYIFFANPNKPD